MVDKKDETKDQPTNNTRPFNQPPEQKTDKVETLTPVPSGLDAATWAAAENSAVGQNGGFAGVGEKGREDQIRKHYDQIVASNKQVNDWAGENGVA